MSDETDREPPQRIRFPKLQEVHLSDLVKVERATTEMYYELGFDAAEVPARSHAELANLTRQHSVHVAEADHLVAGYSAWRDEEPGVGYVEEISIHPDYQRFGLAKGLLEKIYEEAREAGIKQLVLRMWERAPWAREFYRKAGFEKLDDQSAAVPPKVREWFENKNSGRPLLRDGEAILWTSVPKAAEEEEEESEPEDA